MSQLESSQPMELLVVSSSSNHKLLKFVGSIQNTPVRVLIDCGATHDFVNLDFAELCLTPRVHPNAQSPISVQYSDGKCRTFQRTMYSTTINIQNVTVQRDLLAIDLGDKHDVILGKAWLSDVNPRINWQTNEVTFDNGISISANDTYPKDIPFGVNSISIEDLQQEAGDIAVFQVTVKSVSDLLTEKGMEFGDLSTNEIRSLISEFADQFPEELPSRQPPSRGVSHRIELLPNAQVPRPRMFKLSPLEREELVKQLTRLLSLGFLEPSTSPFGAAVFFAQKPGGGMRLVCDWRALNAITVKNAFLVPNMEQLVHDLAGSTIFSHIDVHSAYHQVPIAPEDRQKTAIRTPMGHFEWTVMGFGLCNAPATFQALMNRTLQKDIDGRHCVVYFDDIVVHSNSPEEHIVHLRSVLTKLREQQLFCKPSKCVFARSWIKFLGFIIRSNTISPDPAKVDAIVAMKVPENISEVRTFVGMVTYFFKHMRNFSQLAAPLQLLTHKNASFNWTPDHQQSFEDLKHALSSHPVLQQPNFRQPFTIQCDASDLGMGGVLLQLDDQQQQHAVGYFSRRFDQAQSSWPTHDKELFAVLSCLQHWRHLVENGHTTIVETDHNPLQHFMSQLNLNKRQRRWLDAFAEFDFRIVYKRGSENVVADQLSRSPQVHTISTADTNLFDDVRRNYLEDPWFSRLLSHPQLPRTFSRLNQGLLYLCDTPGTKRLAIPTRRLQTRIMKEHHDLPISGHKGVSHTYRSLRSQYFWPGMKSDIIRFIASCPNCQLTKPAHQLTPGLLVPLPIPSGRWTSVSMDFIVGLPTTPSGHDALFVVVDRFTKRCHLIACKSTDTAEQTAALYCQHVLKLHGVPQSIVSDRDPKFTSDFWQSLWSATGTKLLLSTAQHPQTDGQTERTNRTLGSMFRTLLLNHSSKWKDITPMIEFAYNSSIHSSIGMTPFEADIGYQPPIPTTLFSDNTSMLGISDIQQHLQQLQTEVTDNLIVSQQDQRYYADQRRREQIFKIGDQVLVSAKQLRASGNKFDPTWLGPFTITANNGPNAYTVDLPLEYGVHPTINVSQLKPFHVPEYDPNSSYGASLQSAPINAGPPLTDSESRIRPQRTHHRPQYLNDFETP